MREKNIIDAISISEHFGKESLFYKEIISELKNRYEENKMECKNTYTNWRKYFKKIYGDNISLELFFKHSYYFHLLYALFVLNLNKKKKTNTNSLFERYKSRYYYNDYIQELKLVNWDFPVKKFLLEIQDFIQNKELSDQDLFYRLYQDIFISTTRHSMGEFYTPSILVKKMIQETYKLGDKVLDPTCGSGAFLLQIISHILKAECPISSKKNAISKLYGFDRNPLATFTIKVNILLILSRNFHINDRQLENLPKVRLIDSLTNNSNIITNNDNLDHLKFDLIIGNPPWLTYKDIQRKEYQKKILDLAQELGIKPKSQYITHIELASLFFYSSAKIYLKNLGIIFFVMPKSVLNGDHCEKFRKFSIFTNLEIWDFPNNYFFQVPHICLKARYSPINSDLRNTFPIPAKLFDETLNLKEETKYSTIKANKKGAKKIIPIKELTNLAELEKSPYKEKFFQGATLVPRSLVFFKVKENNKEVITIASDPDILSRAKKKWRIEISRNQIESTFKFYSFLNKDLIPFFLKRIRFVFLPINKNFAFNESYLRKYPKSTKLYHNLNRIYTGKKKSTSRIKNLIDNLNYWNKLEKQSKNSKWITVYNASGSNLKAAVINNEKHNLIIGSENYYYSTPSEFEAYYLSGILNAPLFSKNIKLVKSSRHIHKRPFLFPIPIYSEKNEIHRKIALKSRKYKTLVSDLVHNNPNISSRKVRTLILHKLRKLDALVEKIVFQQ